MKKIIFSAIVAIFAFSTASAQDAGTWSVAPRMNIYTNVGTVVGIGVAGRYSFSDQWRIEPSVMALLHRGCSIDVSCDAQYMFRLNSDWTIYPSAGVTLNQIGSWGFGFNLGGGVDYRVTADWDITGGLKWQPMFSRRNAVVLSVGGAYRF